MNKYEMEIENLKENIMYENCLTNDDFEDVTEKGMVEITTEMFEQAAFLLWQKQNAKQRMHSQRVITELRAKIAKGKLDFPAIAVIRFPTYNFIADGNHRVYALYKEGIKEYEALYVKRRG